MALKFLTAGESHGKALVGILEGVPAGFSLAERDIDVELRRRQQGYGRGGRMKIESDHAEIISGVRWGRTLGSPIGILIRNRDWENWKEGMSAESPHEDSISPVTRPRPGHADLAGVLKFGHSDIRNVLERSSARETAMRVAIGAIAKKLLSEFGINIGSYVVQIGSVRLPAPASSIYISEKGLAEMFAKAEKSAVRCPGRETSDKMMKLIDKATKEGNSLGGVFEVFLTGLPVGLGTYSGWDGRLDGRLAQAVMSIQAIKGVEIGTGFKMAEKSGAQCMDEIFYSRSAGQKETAGFFRKTNNAGGIEGGMTNGMPVVIRAAMKPIPTLRRPLSSVDIRTKKVFRASYERSDICAVPAAAVVAEAMAGLIAATAFLEKFGGDSKRETTQNFRSFISYLKKF